MELALNDSLVKVEYRRIAESNLYEVMFKQLEPEQLDARHLTFEMIYPFYKGNEGYYGREENMENLFCESGDYIAGA